MKTLEIRSLDELLAIILALRDGLDAAEKSAASAFFLSHCVGASHLVPAMERDLARMHLCHEVRERLFRL